MSRNTVLSLLTGASMVIAAGLWPSRAAAQARPEPVGAEHCAPSWFVADDDPFWGPGPYPYSATLDGQCLSASVRVLGTPIQADVYVDGFFAGLVDDFDGVLQRLPITPGDHAITLYLEGYRTVTKHVSVTSGSSLTVRLRMEMLGSDQTSELPPPAVLAGGTIPRGDQ
jgi:hypothetical protein